MNARTAEQAAAEDFETTQRATRADLVLSDAAPHVAMIAAAARAEGYSVLVVPAAQMFAGRSGGITGGALSDGSILGVTRVTDDTSGELVRSLETLGATGLTRGLAWVAAPPSRSPQMLALALRLSALRPLPVSALANAVAHAMVAGRWV